MTKKGPFFGPQNVTKRRRAKNGPPQFKIPAAAVASEINSNLKETFQQICHNEGTKTGPSRGDHF